MLACAPASAQRLIVGDIDETYLRALQVSGAFRTDASLTIRPLGIGGLLSAGSVAGSVADPAADSATAHRNPASDNPAANPWQARWLRSFRGPRSYGLTPASARLVYNSNWPESRNDGAVAPGRHLTQIIDVGAWAQIGPVEFTVRPTIAWVQNAYFRPANWQREGDAALRHPWRSLDLPQRFGNDAYWVVDPGQSEVRVEAKGVSASFGTTSLWWGPGVRNSLLMSNNAAGFPHLSIASARPVDVGFGRFEGQWIFGRLQSSDDFVMPGDPAPDDPGRYLTGAVATFSPNGWGLEGLTLGAARVFYALVPEDGIALGDYFLIFRTPDNDDLFSEPNTVGDDRRDQLVSLFARWVFPESGFELWTEWGRNDHNENLRDYFLHAEHTQAYTLGLQKTLEPNDETLISLLAELTHLQGPADSGVRQAESWYDHSFVHHGYTQRGQVIGAAIGPGSNSQFLGVDVRMPWGQAGAWLERRVNDRDAYRKFALEDPENFGYWRIDAMRTIGLNLRIFQGNWDLGAEAWYTRNFNRYFAFESDQSNYRLDFTVRRRWGSDVER